MKNKTKINKFELELELEKLNCNKKLNINSENYKKNLSIIGLILESGREELIDELQNLIKPPIYTRDNLP